MRRPVAVVVAFAIGGCVPNPRNEIPAIAATALSWMARDSGHALLCVDRQITPWQIASAVRRVDTPAPPGFETVRRAAFRGGGALKGDMVGGIRVGPGATCFDLRGPLVEGDRAMIEVHMPGVGWNVWERRVDGVWRAVTTTTSGYPI